MLVSSQQSIQIKTEKDHSKKNIHREKGENNKSRKRVYSLIDSKEHSNN